MTTDNRWMPARPYPNTDADAASTGLGLMLGSLTSQNGTLLSTVTRELIYQANSVAQNLVPDPQILLGLYYAGRINSAQLKVMLEYHGIDYETSVDPVASESSYRKIAWNHAIDLAAPRFDLGQTRSFLRMGTITLNQAIDVMNRHGFTRNEDVFNYLTQPELIDPSALLRAFLLGIIDRDTLNRQMAWLGIPSASIETLVGTLRNPPTVGDTLNAWLRGIIDEPRMRKYLQWNGYTSQEERDTIAELAKQIPPPSDLITFSVREAWNEQVVQTYGYDNEFPEPFKYWMKAQGYDWSKDVKTESGETVAGVSWPKLYWRSHWRTISPEQSYTMLHRLRGEPNNPATWRVPGVAPFTIENVRDMLKVNDVPPAFRDRLAAISYLPLRLVDIRNALKLEVIVGPNGEKADFDWTVEQFQDRGHNLRDARVQAGLAVALSDAAKNRQANLAMARFNKAWIDQILSNYRDGIFGKAETKIALQALKVGAEQADSMIDLVDVQLNAGMFREVVQQIKADYMSGRIDRPDAINRLTATGMTEVARNRYIFTWDSRKSEGRVFATANKTVDFYKRGYLTYDQATQRLRGQGLHTTDVIMLLAAAQQDLDKLAGKAAQAAEKKANVASKELARLADMSKQLEDKLRADIRRLTPVAKVQKWLRTGLVSLDWAEVRLRAMGFPQELVETYISEATLNGDANATAPDATET